MLKLFIISVLLIGACTFTSYSQLSQARSGSTNGNTAVGGSSTSWSGTSTTSGLGLNEYSDVLNVTNFSFTIPVGSTILGISVRVSRELTNSSGAGYFDRTATINGGAANRASAVVWTGGGATITYGSAVDLWGGTFTAASINAAGFGFNLSVIKLLPSGNGSQRAQVNSVIITVTYTAPLPIDLLEFKGILLHDNSKQIDWSTATETNTLNYDVERSIDGTTFSKIHTTSAAGFSQNKIEYTHIDREYISEPITYYRLIQRDLNGDETIYGPISVVSTAVVNRFDIFPNPSVDWVNMRWNDVLEPKYALVFSADGKELERLNVAQQNRFSFAHLKKGVYVVYLLDESEAVIAKNRLVKY